MNLDVNACAPRRPVLVRAFACAAFVLGLSASAAFAAPPPPVVPNTAIERNLPPAPEAKPTEIAPLQGPLTSDDATPLGPMLKTIVVIGPKDALKPIGSAAVDTSAVARLDNAEARTELAQFIGKPISRKLVSDIAAAIVLYYRAQGFPFVSVSVPPQEITQGAVEFRVVEFKLDAVVVKGNTKTPGPFIVERLRARSGEPIDANLLSQDLDALNRYPFRTIQVGLTPSNTFGETNLELNVTEVPPWRVYAGYSNSGSPSTGWDRISLGGSMGDLFTMDSLLSWQFTSSTDFWYANGNVFGGATRARYLSNAVTLDIPTNARQAIEASIDMIATNTPSQAFIIGSRIYEATLGYRVALSDYMDAPGDFHFGLEAKRDDRSTYFGTTNVATAAIEVYQFYLGWNDLFSSAIGRSSIDATLHIAPGGVDSANNADKFAKFSNNALHSARYVDLNTTFTNFVSLPYDTSWSTELIGQITSDALPETEEFGLGGMSLVRGYTLDDGAYDEGIVARNELRAPPIGLLSLAAGSDAGPYFNDVLAPYLFVDIGVGHLRTIHKTANAGSVGLGADYSLDGILTASLDGAYAFESAPFTKSGALRVDARVTMTY